SHHLFYSYSVHFDLLSFPTRRSSDVRFFIFHRGGEPSANLENPGRERHGRRVSPAPATMTCGAVAREISPKRECPAKSPSKSPGTFPTRCGNAITSSSLRIRSRTSP